MLNHDIKVQGLKEKVSLDVLLVNWANWFCCQSTNAVSLSQNYHHANFIIYSDFRQYLSSQIIGIELVSYLNNSLSSSSSLLPFSFPHFFPLVVSSTLDVCSSSVEENLTVDCNAGCSCIRELYNPVCGSDGMMYYSPCHAGCSTINHTLPSTGKKVQCKIILLLYYTCAYGMLWYLLQLSLWKYVCRCTLDAAVWWVMCPWVRRA